MAVRKIIKPATRPIGPVELGPGRVRYAAGMRAGRWVFATGHKGTDYGNGMAAAVLRPRAPRHHKPKHKRETEQIYRNISAVMRAGGTTMRNVVRLDQYYSTHRAVDPYHEVRLYFLRVRIPPSTSILQKGFLLPGQERGDVGCLQDTRKTAKYYGSAIR